MLLEFFLEVVGVVLEVDELQPHVLSLGHDVGFLLGDLLEFLLLVDQDLVQLLELMAFLLGLGGDGGMGLGNDAKLSLELGELLLDLAVVLVDETHIFGGALNLGLEFANLFILVLLLLERAFEHFRFTLQIFDFVLETVVLLLLLAEFHELVL